MKRLPSKAYMDIFSNALEVNKTPTAPHQETTFQESRVKAYIFLSSNTRSALQFGRLDFTAPYWDPAEGLMRALEGQLARPHRAHERICAR